MKTGGAGLALALVRDMHESREPSGSEEIEAFETDVLAGFVLARASAGLADTTVRNDTGHLDPPPAGPGRAEGSARGRPPRGLSRPWPGGTLWPPGRCWPACGRAPSR